MNGSARTPNSGVRRFGAASAASAAMVMTCVVAAFAQPDPSAMRQTDDAALPLALQKISDGETARRWAQDAVWYHIVVSRFCNEDPTNDPPVEFDPPLDHVLTGPGDIRGLHAQLPYLKLLGVNTLLLSDVFAVRHDVRPPALDLFHVRPELLSKPAEKDAHKTGAPPSAPASGDEILLAFLEDARSLGFRVVFHVPLEQTWLPDDAAEAIGHLTAACAKWTRNNAGGRGVDGWMIRSPQRLPANAWMKWCAKLRDSYPTVLLVADEPGEVDAWTQDGLFDVAVDHRTGELVRRYLAVPHGGLSCQKLANEFNTLKGGRAAPIFLGSPMTSRLMDELSREPDRHDALSEKTPIDSERDAPLARWRLALAIQFFLPGAPAIFAGDEYGLRGHSRFGSVPPMIWRNEKSGRSLPAGDVDRHLPWLRWLIERRDIHRPLRHGSFEVVLCDDKRHVLAISRELPGEKVILVTNAGPERAEVVLPVARPRQLVGVLTPRWDQEAKGSPAKPAGHTGLPSIRLGGSRQFADGGGHVRLRLAPMSVSVVLVRE
jgi:hypothetical protein